MVAAYFVDLQKGTDLSLLLLDFSQQLLEVVLRDE
jgi:hypothetical protein